jgi:hypothetical protein
LTTLSEYYGTFPSLVLCDLPHVQISQALSLCYAIPTSLLLSQDSGLVCFLLILLPATVVLDWSQGLTLVKQVLYCLSHIPSLFDSGDFDRFLLFAQASLYHNPPIYASCNSWNDRHLPPYPALSVKHGFMKICLNWPGTVIL